MKEFRQTIDFKADMFNGPGRDLIKAVNKDLEMGLLVGVVDNLEVSRDMEKGLS